MSVHTVPDSSLKSVVGDKLADYHCFLLANGVIWAFSQNYHAQKKYNWGHRVVHKGGYAVGFDLKLNKWSSPVEFGALYSDENSEEVLFEMGGTIYMLIMSGFNDIAFQGLYRWAETKWEKVDFKAPGPVHLHDDNINVRVIVADSNHPNERYLVFSVSQDLRLYKMNVSASGAAIEECGQIPVRQLQVVAPMASQAVLAGNRLLISYMTRGCGYMWDADRFITYNTETKQFDHIHLPEDEEHKARPPFGQTGGGKGHGLSPSGTWIHAGGSSRYGMADSRYESSVWALQELQGEPIWVKLGLEIPENVSDGIIVSPNGEILAVGKETVGKASF